MAQVFIEQVCDTSLGKPTSLALGLFTQYVDQSFPTDHFLVAQIGFSGPPLTGRQLNMWTQYVGGMSQELGFLCTDTATSFVTQDGDIPHEPVRIQRHGLEHEAAKQVLFPQGEGQRSPLVIVGQSDALEAGDYSVIVLAAYNGCPEIYQPAPGYLQAGLEGAVALFNNSFG
jgi:hypothetical protein